LPDLQYTDFEVGDWLRLLRLLVNRIENRSWM